MNARIKAIVEILTIWALAVLGFKAIRASPLGAWEDRVLGRYLFEYMLVLLLPLFWLRLTRRSLALYGLCLAFTRHQGRVLVTLVIPMFMISAALGFLGWQRWGNALLISGLEIAILITVAWLLRDRCATSPAGPTATCLMVGLFARQSSTFNGAGAVVPRLIFGLLLVALGEEVLFRGYIQPRLNETWGQPCVLWGVRWGWGAVITAGLFGLWHVLNPWNPFLGSSGLAWSWGLWTFFLGLILGYVRERTGSVWVSAILHWLINL